MAALRLLVVKMSSMGDVVHAQPLATDLRQHFPQARIEWVCESAFAAIPAMNPAVDEVIPLSWRRWRRRLHRSRDRHELAAFWRRLRSVPYDWVFDCQGLIKSAVVTRLARAQRRAGPDWDSAREAVASLAYDCRLDIDRKRHVVARNRAVAAQALGYSTDSPANFGLRAPEIEIEGFPSGFLGPGQDSLGPGNGWVDTREAMRPYAALITGASRVQKLWPDEHWLTLAAELRDRGLPLLWLWGSPAERERARRLAAATGSVWEPGASVASPWEFDSVVPPFVTIAQAAALLGRARLVVGLDTGFTHLAAALGRPSIGIFCDFDAVQCAVSGDGPCASFGGIGQIPPVATILASVGTMLENDRCT